MSGERQSDIVVARLQPELADEIETRLEATLRGQGEKVELRVADKHVSDALKLLVESGAEVVSVTPQRASLEEIFLTAVEEGEA